MPVARRLLDAFSLLVAGALWLPAVHVFFMPERAPLARGELSATGDALLARQLRLWEDPAERKTSLEPMRASNAEWDFMGRTFLVLALGNLSIAHPDQRTRYLAVIDRIIDETLVLERERGMFHFLMPYAMSRPFVVSPPRSAFVDGEIALMLGTRHLVAPSEAVAKELGERVAHLRSQMQASPVLSAESYPDECWTFCNTMALAAMRMDDAIHGGRRGADFAARWIERAKASLVDPDTGLLVSSFTVDGRHMDGPEGSSIWVAAHALLLVDPAFAKDQYDRARRYLGVDFLGFGWAREWPRGAPDRPDIDSGPIVPILDVSPGSSGLAFLGAKAFGDDRYWRRLLTTLDFAALPVR